VVVLWVLDVPRQVFNMSLYTEQMLTVCLGLTLALAFIADTSRKRHWSDWLAMALSLGLCAYIAARYATLTDEIALIPLSGLIVSAVLIVLIMEASRRTNGWGFVGMIAAMAVYVYISPHLSGDFQTRYVSPERMTVYLGLDINGAIGSILHVAVIVVIPFTILGQVLARTGGADFLPIFRWRPWAVFVAAQQNRGGRVGAVRHDFRQRGQQCARGRHRHDSDDGALGLHALPRSGNRIRRIDRRATDAAGDGRCGLHHGRIPAGALWRGLRRSRHPGISLLRLSFLPRRS
jgi:hypothetical protein